MQRPDDENTGGKEAPSLGDRLLAAILAPVLFNLSVLVAYAVVFRHGRWLRRQFHSAVPLDAPLIVLLVLPIAVGLIFGTNGVINLIGHAFYTHSESERDARVTIAIWVCISLAACWLANAG